VFADAKDFSATAMPMFEMTERSSVWTGVKNPSVSALALTAPPYLGAPIMRCKEIISQLKLTASLLKKHAVKCIFEMRHCVPRFFGKLRMTE
jgi:hypothetical protein